LRRVLSGVWLPAEEVTAFTSVRVRRGRERGRSRHHDRVAIKDDRQCHSGLLGVICDKGNALGHNRRERINQSVKYAAL
jgi:hypothetical protein